MIDLPQIPPYIMHAAEFIGIAVAAFLANRSSVQSTATRKEVAATRKEVTGPDNEPSLRDLIKAQGALIQVQGSAIVTLSSDIHKDFGAVHVELDGVSQRIEKLERAVFSTLEARLKIVEDFVFKHSTRKRKP